MTSARATLALAASIAALGGCTLLVSFDDMPTDDAGLGVTDARPPLDVAVADTGGPNDEDAGLADASVDYSKACVGQVDGKYCNGDFIVVDGGSKDDLITCLAGKTVSAKLCANACQRMPTGYPDECDPCKGKATGLYCGDDFVGWHPKNANTRIRCDNGAIVGNVICATTCVGTGPNASCQ